MKELSIDELEKLSSDGYKANLELVKREMQKTFQWCCENLELPKIEKQVLREYVAVTFDDNGSDILFHIEKDKVTKMPF